MYIPIHCRPQVVDHLQHLSHLLDYALTQFCVHKDNLLSFSIHYISCKIFDKPIQYEKYILYSIHRKSIFDSEYDLYEK